MVNDIVMSQCPQCGGVMLRSGNLMKDKSFAFWGKPWQSWESTIVPVWTWACMDCGMVFQALDKKDKVKAEFQDRVKSGEIRIPEKLLELVKKSKGVGQRNTQPARNPQPPAQPRPQQVRQPKPTQQPDDDEVEFEIG